MDQTGSNEQALNNLVSEINAINGAFLMKDLDGYLVMYNGIRLFDLKVTNIQEKKDYILSFLSQLSSLLNTLQAHECDLKGDDWGDSTWLTYKGVSLYTLNKNLILAQADKLMAQARQLSLLLNQLKALNCELKGDDWGKDLLLTHKGLILHSIPGTAVWEKDEEVIGRAKTFYELLLQLKHYGCNLRGDRHTAFLTYSDIALYACPATSIAENNDDIICQAQEAMHHYSAITAQYAHHSKGEPVNLGLPSGNRWATCNVGADSPFGAGRYFAWAETEYYTGAHNKWLNQSIENPAYTKYCKSDGLTTLAAEDDAATTANPQLCLPSEDDFDELEHFCLASWVDNFMDSGTNGLLIVSKKNFQSIFLPAAGLHTDKGPEEEGCCGNYWTSSLFTQDVSYAYEYYFDAENNSLANDLRKKAFSIRPVLKVEITK